MDKPDQGQIHTLLGMSISMPIFPISTASRKRAIVDTKKLDHREERTESKGTVFTEVESQSVNYDDPSIHDWQLVDVNCQPALIQ